MNREEEWEKLLDIRTSGRDDSLFDGEHHPYEPTDYSVLERLAASGLIRKKNTLLDYGSGKGRTSIFMAYQTGCHSMGIEYDRRLYERALQSAVSYAARHRVSFILGDAASCDLPGEVDTCFFFNPFALPTLKKVMENIFRSLERTPRPFRLFFYYPQEEIEDFLNHHPRLIPEEIIDCRDLFPEDDEKEKILIYHVTNADALHAGKNNEP